MSNRGLAFVLSAPAGTGKTTLVGMLTQKYPHIVQSISCTSRAQRPEEREGVDYRFLTEEEFIAKEKAGDFLESVTLYGNRYGTDRKWVEEQRDLGNHVFLVIDTQGALKLKEKYDVITIFVRPPSLDELEKRLRGRQTESEESIQKRLAWAREELKRGEQYDYTVVNDNLEKAFDELCRIVGAQ